MVQWKWSFFVPKHDNESCGYMNLDENPSEIISVNWSNWWPNVKQPPKLVYSSEECFVYCYVRRKTSNLRAEE